MTTATLRHEPASPSEKERELGAIISAYYDVTERLKCAHERLEGEVQRLREELRRKNAELRRREQLAALGEMAAGLAHEVRNPLGGIALYASMLEKELAGREGASTAAARISQGVRSLERLVAEILDFAQEDRLQCAWCELPALLADARSAVTPWAADAAARVHVAAPAGLRAWCDAPRIQRVLVNLLLNGLTAAGPTGGVRVAAERGADGGVTIEVTDDGPGIAEEHLDRIFNPFFTTRPDGTGLGLAIVHRIVEAHGGSIRASNRPEGGARFVIRLPAGPGL